MKTRAKLVLAAILCAMSGIIFLTYQGISASNARSANMEALKDAMADARAALNAPCAPAAVRSAIAPMALLAKDSPRIFAALGTDPAFLARNAALQQQIQLSLQAHSCAEMAVAQARLEQSCKDCHSQFRNH
jgi:hypothetical protein